MQSSEIPEPDVVSVATLSNQLKRVIDQNFRIVHVRGEISGLKRHASGHLYYALKDADAVIDAVSWRGTYTPGNPALQEGMEVVVRGRVTIYPGRSKYQIIVEHITLAGVGALLQLLEQRKKALAAEGLFDAQHKRPLPLLPHRIAVVTSPTGAVIQDILHRLRERFPCTVLVYPVPVQGEDAAPQVCQALYQLNQLREPDRPQLIIVARGGGSVEDLWAFNEETVARAVFASEIPVISAIGHETDVTLVDYVADRRAPTPTAAAEMATPVRADLQLGLRQTETRILQVMHQYIRERTLRLTLLCTRIPQPQQVLETLWQRVDDVGERLQRGFQGRLDRIAERMTYMGARLRFPQRLFAVTALSLEHLEARMLGLLAQYLQHQTMALESWTVRLEQSSFQRTLKRGFCLATLGQDELIAQGRQFPERHIVQLHFHDATVPVTKAGHPPQKRLRRKSVPTTRAVQLRLFD